MSLLARDAMAVAATGAAHAALVGLAGLAGACAAQTTVVVSQPADIRSTDPGVDRDNTTDGVLLHIVEGLVGYRQNGSVGPLLAQAWSVSRDGRTYSFQLRKGLKFHNGAALTAADVAWSWKRYMDPKTAWRCLNEFDGRGSARVVATLVPDPYTFVMKLDRPSAVFLDTLARTDCGMTAVLHAGSVKADGSWDKPIGTGPFAFGEWKRGESVTLTAFKDYQSPAGSRPDGYTGAKRPLVDAVKFVVAAHPSAARAGLESGSVDAGQITASDAQELTFGTSYNAKLRAAPASTGTAKPGLDPGIKVLIARQASKNALLLQTRDPLLRNEKIRHAIAASLDIRQLVSLASEGMAAVNSSAVPEGSAFHSAAQKTRYQHDPALARKLLHEAGYRGEPITIQANQRASVPSHSIAMRAQAMMRAAGINAQIELLDWPVQLERYNKGSFQISSFTYSSRLDPGLSYEQFVGDKSREARKVWDDPLAQKLVDTSLVEADPKKRQALFDELHGLMLKQAPLILLYNGIDTWAVRKRIAGFSVWEGKPRAWNTQVLPVQ